MPQGKVKRLVADRGFGFIETERGDDLFFHHSEVQGASIEELREGQRVEYAVGQGRKGPCATRIRLALPPRDVFAAGRMSMIDKWPAPTGSLIQGV